MEYEALPPDTEEHCSRAVEMEQDGVVICGRQAVIRLSFESQIKKNRTFTTCMCEQHYEQLRERGEPTLKMLRRKLK